MINKCTYFVIGNLNGVLKPWHHSSVSKPKQTKTVMTTSIQSLRSKSIRQAKLKLDQHRQLGIQSSLNIFEVADLLDSIRLTEEKLSTEPQGFALILN